MKMKLQLRTPIYAGLPYNQIAGTFLFDDDTGNVLINTILGAALFHRDEIVYAVFLSDDFDMSIFLDDENILVIDPA